MNLILNCMSIIFIPYDQIQLKKENNYFSKTELMVLKIMIINKNVTQKTLSAQTGLSLSTIKRELKKLQNNNYIERIGGTRGYWHVLKKIEV